MWRSRRIDETNKLAKDSVRGVALKEPWRWWGQKRTTTIENEHLCLFSGVVVKRKRTLRG
jgi:hypothetical protein